MKWNGERHGLDLDPDSIVISDGVYPGAIAALRSFVPIGNRVLLTTPAYSGFYGMARAARVDTVDSPMLYRNGRYEIDWADLESKMTADVRATIVCNPQNSADAQYPITCPSFRGSVPPCSIPVSG